MSNQRLLREIPLVRFYAESKPITTIIRQRQLWLYGHEARYPENDPASRPASVRVEEAKGAPTKFVGQVDASYWKVKMASEGWRGDATLGVMPPMID